MELDPAGGTTYVPLGITQLVSVPYALYSEKTGQTYSAGYGIDITDHFISNTAPDQPVGLSSGYGISISGTYPNFTVDNTLPDQPVSLIGTGATTVTGSYPGFTIHSTEVIQYVGGSGINITSNIITNTAPNAYHTGDALGSEALTVAGIQGRPVAATAPTLDQVLKWNGSQWEPATVTSGGDTDDWTLTGNSGTDPAVGIKALYNNTTRSNLVAIVDSALYNNGLDATLTYHATGNTAIGSKALYSNTNGYRNTAIGFQALQANNTGAWNTASGYQTLYTNSTGANNQAVGPQALYFNTTGSYNTAVGRAALFNNSDGNANIAIGHYALYSNITNDYNTAIGRYACYYVVSDNNTAFGYGAGDNYTFVSGTFLGACAYPNANGYTNCMALGYNARITASNWVVIGNEDVTSIGGYAGWTNFSDGRYKKNIHEDVPGLEFIKQLRPVTYTLDVTSLNANLNKNRPVTLREGEESRRESPEDIASREAKEKIVYTGFIAQEVEEAAQRIGYDFSGLDGPQNPDGNYGLRYAAFVVPLVKAVQEQQAMIEVLQKKVAALEAEVGNKR